VKGKRKVKWEDSGREGEKGEKERIGKKVNGKIF
jgi:hypothetical protein